MLMARITQIYLDHIMHTSQQVSVSACFKGASA